MTTLTQPVAWLKKVVRESTALVLRLPAGGHEGIAG